MNLETGLLDRFLSMEWLLRKIQSPKSKTQFQIEAVEKHIFPTLCEMQHKAVYSLFPLFIHEEKIFFIPFTLAPEKNPTKICVVFKNIKK